MRFMRNASPDMRDVSAETIARKGIDRAVAKRSSSMVADELQGVYVCWKNNTILLPTGESQPDNGNAVVAECLKAEEYSEVLTNQLIQNL
jgi:hypothetical protein